MSALALRKRRVDFGINVEIWAGAMTQPPKTLSQRLAVQERAEPAAVQVQDDPGRGRDRTDGLDREPVDGLVLEDHVGKPAPDRLPRRSAEPLETSPHPQGRGRGFEQRARDEAVGSQRQPANERAQCVRFPPHATLNLVATASYGLKMSTAMNVAGPVPLFSTR
jgi:hypothetical protein